MRGLRFAPTLLPVLLAVPLPVVPGQASGEVVVHVHLINAKTGKPIAHKPIRMWSLDPPGLWRNGPKGWVEEADQDGVAVYHLSYPLPRRVLIHTGMGGYWEECLPNDRAGFDLGEILTRGISKMGACINAVPNLGQSFRPKPGDVYLFAEHLTFWEHVTRCGVWGCRGTPGQSGRDTSATEQP